MPDHMRATEATAIGAWVHWCIGAWVRGCVGAWVHGCMGAWAHGRMGAWAHMRICAQLVKMWVGAEVRAHPVEVARGALQRVARRDLLFEAVDRVEAHVAPFSAVDVL